MSLFHLKLRAQNFDQNIDRDYEILVLKILFGFWGVTLAFGRHGTGGMCKNYIFETKEQARLFVHKTIQKRLKAPKRIGCAYALMGVSVAKNEDFGFWLTPVQEKALTQNSDQSKADFLGFRKLKK